MTNLNVMQESAREWHLQEAENRASALTASSDGESTSKIKVENSETNQRCPCRSHSPTPEYPTLRAAQRSIIERRLIRNRAFMLEYEGLTLYVDSYGWTFDNRSGVSRPFRGGMNSHVRTLLGMPSGTAPKARR